MAVSASPDLNALCLACGLCCDGTVESFVLIEPGEAWPEDAEVPAPVNVVNGTEVYPLPCAFLRGKICSIYKARPADCRSYRCKTLTLTADGLIGNAEALERIRKVRGAREDLVALVGRENATERGRLRMLLELDTGIAKGSVGAVKLAIGVLEILVDRYFRSDGRRKLKHENLVE